MPSVYGSLAGTLEECMTPSKEVIDTLEAIRSEINCGKLLKPERLMTPEERAWCNAHDRCMAIVANYKDGLGLYQMTGKIKQKAK